MCDAVEPDATRRDAGRPMRELWAQLSANMRVLRTGAGASLRAVEAESGFGRGTLSQVETGKARPNRALVEFYDDRFAGDGMLVSLYAEARGAHGPSRGLRRDPVVRAGDDATVSAAAVPFGQLVACGASLRAGWTLHNAGTVPWRGRRLARVGPQAGVRLIASAPSVAIADCEPGASVECPVDVVVPDREATYAAAWHMVDESGLPALPLIADLSLLVIARNVTSN